MSITVVPPRGEFTLRICAGCGYQLTDGHHAHGGKLSPAYEVPAVPASALDDLVHVDQAFAAEQEAAYLRDVLRKIANRRPSQEKAAATFHRSREDAREALRVAAR